MKRHIIPLLTYTAVLASVALFGLVIWGAGGGAGGVSVSVKNVGNRELKSVVVHVTGRSYDLGSIAPGQTASTRVSPKGESHVELTIIDDDSNRATITIDCYFESRGYQGAVMLDIEDCRLVDSKVNIGTSLF